MDYTHYWNQFRPFTEEEWKNIQEAFWEVTEEAKRRGVRLEWEFMTSLFYFNGTNPESCENLCIRKIPTNEFNFCKTRQFPYDAAVVTMLAEMQKIAPSAVDIGGGARCAGGTDKAWLNVTYNYAKHYYRVMGKEGIRSIYDKSGAESISILENAISQLGDDVSEDYWEAAEGNAKQALYGLLAFAKMRPDGVWDGD